ncbi:MAG TPA: radical SAM protein [Syntrophales bacterium]|nr:radical SAM protein [Syntrophales bacterium]
MTRNCPWNKCNFCPAYKGTRFSRRTVEEIKRDIESMARERPGRDNQFQTAFLQDADSLLLPTAELLEILRYLKEKFPGIRRVTSYARAPTLRKKGVQDLKQLKEAGLLRIHAGLESGSAKVLKMIKKGITPEDITAGGRNVLEAGISLSEYIMPGVGGRKLSEEHAFETARLLNIVKPDFIRIRTFALHPLSPLNVMIREGEFVPLTDEEIVAEIRLLLTHLEETHTYFSCADYGRNLLMQVEGYLDEKRAFMLEEIDRYLSLTKEQKQAYSLLRRSTYMSYPLDVVFDETVMRQIRPEIEKLEKQDGFNKHIQTLTAKHLPEPQGAWD